MGEQNMAHPSSNIDEMEDGGKQVDKPDLTAYPFAQVKVITQEETKYYRDIAEVSDGYHTFDELYGHRIALFIALMHAYPERSWFADKHEDGTMFGAGWFIAGMHLPTGDISYHLPTRYFHNLGTDKRIRYMYFAPHWDGHTPQDVVNRLNRWSQEQGNDLATTDSGGDSSPSNPPSTTPGGLLV